MTRMNPYAALIEWFARNPVAANLLMFIILLGGLYSAFTIKKEAQPKIETNMVTVSMPFLGASPEDVEEGILVKIEEAIQDIEGIKEIISTARRGSGTVQAEVLTDYDVSEVMDEIKARVDAIPTFPDNTEKPVVSRTRFEQQVLMVTVFGSVPERTLKEFAKQVRNEIVTLPGVTRAQILGGRDYEISIEVSEHTLQAYDLTLAEVAAAIRQGSLDLPAGSIRSEAGDIQVRTKGQAYVGRDFEEIVIRTNADGTRVLLKDVATINDGFVDYDNYSRFDGHPAITTQVLSVGDQSELDIAATVKAWVDARKATLPEGISMAHWADSSYYLKGRLDMMLENLLIGAVLVFLSLALFLRLKLAFWVMVGLPVAFLGTFLFMPQLGVTVNMISLFGFIVVLGIVVDDAIVVGESAYTNMRAKGHSVENVVEGVMRVAIPATFGVLTTIAAFIPVLMVSGPSGVFFSSMGYVVVMCLAFSIVESKLILPAHLAHMKVKHYGDNPGRFIRFQRFFSEGLHRFVDNRYAPFLARCLRRKWLTLSAFISLLILSIGLVAGGVLRVVFFPDIAADFLMVNLEMNEGTPSHQTHEALDRVQDGLRQVDAEVSAEIGVESGAVIGHLLAFARSETSGQIVAELVKDENATIQGPEVLRRWRAAVGEIPGVKQLGFAGAAGPGGGPSISIQLIGASIEQVARASQELERRVRGYAGTYDVRNSYERGRPEIKIDLKPEAEALGLTLSDLANQVRAAFYGVEVQRVQRGQDEVKVMVRYPRSERDSVGYLEDMRIRTPQGGRVPFGAVAEVQLAESPLFIQRFDRERAVRITAEVDKEEYEPEKITSDIMTKELPEVLAQFPGVRSRLSGSSQQAQETQVELMQGALLALFLIYALMAIPLRSYAQPLIIMSVIPFGIIGAMVGHWVLGLPVSMISWFGIIALSGVVVNDSLILVDYINHARAEGRPLMDAVVDASRTRFRPILLTSLTTFLGLAPITIFEKSLQAQLVIPMATSLSFGIVFATAITLVLIPTLYLILDSFGRWWREAWSHALPGKRPAEPPATEQDMTDGPNQRPEEV
ncbi:efflux RND transporter permease subunit [Marinihelvus fidelis]|uniref:Efflux RND transporter permease subunit n=1 Tax=Marinihelvus fidelis TaxID=2613842 RepID=A0A5N0TET7_9GAMM|nr:efflux RND transporter permease subunit [Marinihelvus fidelis]KAA9133562.1 efflux RND transporter permease subunit [Marinihelvus fidelis]